MSFSRAQQGHYRPLVKAAWLRHCALNTIDPKDKVEEKRWYRGELHSCVGKVTTKACDPKRDFEKAIAHFEAETGEKIYWQMKLHSGDKRRIIHECQKLAHDFDCDEEYLQGIARQALSLDELPTLESLSYDQLFIILRAVKTQLRREHNLQKSPTAAVNEAATITDPF